MTPVWNEAAPRTGARPPDPAERRVRARSAPLYVRDAGTGVAVVLLHDFPLNGRMWQPQFEALQVQARLIVPDLPGFGLSPTPATAQSIDDYAGAVVATLDELGVDDVVLVGLSMGAYVGFRLLEHLRERVRGVLLAATRAGPDSPAAAAERHALAAEIEADGIEVAAGAFVPKLLGGTTLQTRPELLEHVHAIIRENDPAGVAAALRAMAARPDASGPLSLLRCPVVCVAGAEDTLAPPTRVGEMAAAIPDGTLSVIPDAGHLVNLEAPIAFNDAVRSLLATCEARNGH